ncbi:MAG TPA: GDP-L-fucose synthase [Thermoanaerobaculia bacterium]|nr:GDP-L-fucose synthase [Thermoanaerobaculia bacterium]
MSASDRIFVAGHNGMVGSAVVRELTRRGFTNLITAPRKELDLRDQPAVSRFLERTTPHVVILAAARVGGIHANNTFPADFIYENLAVQNAVIHESHVHGVRDLVFLGSSCIYPRACPQPIREEYLLSGPLEPTNEPYAIAKIAGIRMAQAYQRQYGLRVICPMPCNLYGTNDSFDPRYSHVLSSLVKRFSDAVDAGDANVTVWGSGTPRREFLHVDDLARAVVLLAEKWDSPEIVNVGSGTDVTIRELAELIAKKSGFTGTIEWDTSMPDGTPRKLLDISRIAALGWQPEISLERGVEMMIGEYRARAASPRV